MTKENILTVATLVAGNANEVMVVPMARSGGVWWCVRQEYNFSRHEDVSTFNLLHKDIL
jgi:hypothetical protein